MLLNGAIEDDVVSSEELNKVLIGGDDNLLPALVGWCLCHGADYIVSLNLGEYELNDGHMIKKSEQLCLLPNLVFRLLVERHIANTAVQANGLASRLIVLVLGSSLVTAAGSVPADYNLVRLHLSAHLLKDLNKPLNTADGFAVGGDAGVYNISSEIHIQGVNNHNSLHSFILPISSLSIV